jgi:hypothetical protein
MIVNGFFATESEGVAGFGGRLLKKHKILAVFS